MFLLCIAACIHVYLEAVYLYILLHTHICEIILCILRDKVSSFALIRGFENWKRDGGFFLSGAPVHIEVSSSTNSSFQRMDFVWAFKELDN